MKKKKVYIYIWIFWSNPSFSLKKKMQENKSIKITTNNPKNNNNKIK